MFHFNEFCSLSSVSCDRFNIFHFFEYFISIFFSCWVCVLFIFLSVVSWMIFYFFFFCVRLSFRFSRTLFIFLFILFFFFFLVPCKILLHSLSFSLLYKTAFISRCCACFFVRSFVFFFFVRSIVARLLQDVRLESQNADALLSEKYLKVGE